MPSVHRYTAGSDRGDTIRCSPSFVFGLTASTRTCEPRRGDSSTDRGYRTEWSAYVTGRGSAAALDEARAVAVAAVGVYMLDLADLIQQARGDDATTMRAMAGLLQAKARISPAELVAQADLAERLARVEEVDAP